MFAITVGASSERNYLKRSKILADEVYQTYFWVHGIKE